MRDILKLRKPHSCYRYADKPLYMKPRVREISNVELQHKYKFHRREDVYVNPHDDFDIPNISSSFTDQFPNIAQQISDNEKKLVICDMPEGIGAGVFTTSDIKFGEAVCLYAGVIESVMPIRYSDIATQHYHFMMESETDSATVPMQINAEHYGNIARFIQDLPNPTTTTTTTPTYTGGRKFRNTDDNDLLFECMDFSKSYRIPFDHKSKIAYANLISEFITIPITANKNCKIPIFYAAEDISAGEMLGYQYSIFDRYWHSVFAKRRFFLPQGELIDHTIYQCTACFLVSDDFRFCRESFGRIHSVLKSFVQFFMIESASKRIPKLAQCNAKLKQIFPDVSCNIFQFFIAYLSCLYYNLPANEKNCKFTQLIVNNTPNLILDNLIGKLTMFFIENHFTQASPNLKSPADLIQVTHYFADSCFKLAQLYRQNEQLDQVTFYLQITGHLYHMLDDIPKAKELLSYAKAPATLPIETPANHCQIL